MDALFGLLMIIGFIYGGCKLAKLLWKHGIIQVVLRNVCIALLTGGILYSLTGSTSFGLGGGITLAVASVIIGGDVSDLV